MIVPAWLEPPALGDRQGTLHDRLEEIRARLQATVDSADKPQATQGSGAEPPKLTAEQAKLIEHLKVALPHVGDASTAMGHARESLAGTQLADAQKAEREALDALAKAIEEFADLKQTIELAYGTQQQLVALLSPEGSDKLPPAERAQDTKDALDGNIGRMDRIKDQLVEQTQQLAAQAQQIEAKAAGSGSAAPDPKQVEAAKQQLEQAKQQLAAAESLRGEAATALGELGTAIKQNKDPLAKAKLAEDKLAELRKLFFSVIEHLQELVREQGETRDQTAKADSEDDFTREPELPNLAQHEGQHGDMAQAIADALAKQADAAQKQPPQQGPDAKALSAAADEVRQGKIDMTNAKGTLDKAVTTKTQSVALKPAVDSEAKAIEHLKKALELLQPPQKQDQNKQDQQQQQQQQQQQKQDKQQQQGGAGQRARDDDAKRQREKQQHGKSEPVDQDW